LGSEQENFKTREEAEKDIFDFMGVILKQNEASFLKTAFKNDDSYKKN